jgi:hypothetical protein
VARSSHPSCLLRHDITPLRFTDHRVEHEPRAILADLRHFLGVR